MGAYILRRLLLIIPTLVGIMLINFALVQFVPGGPVEQAIARLQGGGDVFEGFAGSGNDAGNTDLGSNDSQYVGARGLPPEFIAELEREFGFDKPPVERFLNMMWNYIRFDFGESYFRSISVVDLVLEKMPVSITLGLWSTVIAYAISIPASMLVLCFLPLDLVGTLPGILALCSAQLPHQTAIGHIMYLPLCWLPLAWIASRAALVIFATSNPSCK